MLQVETHHPSSCDCCRGLRRDSLDRRLFLRGIAAGGATFLLQPHFAAAATGNYQAMVLACIDPRLQRPVADYMSRRRLTGQYSQFVVAGAAIGVVAPAFADWHKTFWDNLAASVQLHRIKKVIAIDHRDCGAAKIAYGAEKVASPKAETQTHRETLAEFRKQVAQRQPNLGVETGLMGLNGRIEMFG